MNPNIVNALTIDVEEWYQTILFLDTLHNKGQRTDLPENIYAILKMLDEHSVKATFFILGTVAKKYPDLIKHIAENGHEISSHGYKHKLVYKMTEQEFTEDTISSLEILKKCSGTHILGYRASTWSITPNMLWAIKKLRSLGLRYDSSIYPTSMNLFKCRKLRRSPYEILENFTEFPPSSFQFLDYNFPFAGGTFLRYFSQEFIDNKIAEINNVGSPSIIYFHSWEFDCDLPLNKMSKWKKLIQYGNIHSVKPKIELLLQKYKFSSVKDVLQIEKQQEKS